MPIYPTSFPPSSVSPPAILDPMWEFPSDSGVSIRRVKHSRPCRRWTMEYLGKTVDEMRQIRDFLMQQRLGTFEFSWFHPTAIDRALFQPTTPVTVQWRHGLFTNAWIIVNNSPNAGLNSAAWQVTRIDAAQVTLNGSTAAGVAGVGDVIVYVPRARAVMQEEGTFPSPAILIGPEQVPSTGRRTGYYNFTVVLEELY